MDHHGQASSGGEEGGGPEEDVDAWALLRASKRAIEALRREFGRVHAHDRAIGDEHGAPAERDRYGQSDGA